jgi:phosphatidylglycerol---prolipoprotein diacylglyceryl transferase
MIWNPSEGIHLGPITIRFYSLMFVVAFGLGWYITKKMFDRENESQEKLDSLFMWTFLATLLGARLGHVFFYDWEYFRNHLAEILLPVRFEPEFEFTGFTGLASHGAAIGIVGAMYFFSKKIMMRPMLWTLDRVVIPVASGAVFVRLGNFFNSEIIGYETQSAFGIRFVRDQFTPNKVVRETNITDVNEAYAAIISDPKYATLLAEVPARHPTQLYEAFFYIFVFAILFFMYWKTDARKKLGLLFGSFLVLLFSVRFFVEFLKESQGGFESSLNDFLSLSTGQWLSIPMVLVGLYFVFRPKKVLEV